MAEQGFTLTSQDFVPDAGIPRQHTCDGENSPPTLHWIHPPAGTKSFALLLIDPDAPDDVFTHWVLYDIPPQTERLAANDSTGVKGRNDFQHIGYGGPCPPPNHNEHRYFFRLYALDIDSLNLGEGAGRIQLEQAIEGHILDQCELMGRYKRTTG